MLSPRAPRYTCMRCRLRETLLQLRSQRQRRPFYQSLKRTRSFATHPRHCDEFTQPVPKRREKDIVWKHYGKHGEGRIIGRPGKWQRAVSEKLSTKILDERVSPSQIIVFQDVRDEPLPTSSTSMVQQAPSAGRKVLSAKEIEDEIVGRQSAPEETEVNASIEGLRPSETVVDEAGFDKLSQTLTKSYSLRQLSQYLVKSIPGSASSGNRSTLSRRRVASVSSEISELASSQWRPGQTSLERRHVNVIVRNKSNSRLGIADQILRLAWHITVQSEVQGTGELEIKMQPWQLSMLFDLSTSDGRPYWERFINPSMLLKASSVLPYRPDNVVRVVGRRQVAEEVAQQLKLALLRTDTSEIDLADFAAAAQPRRTSIDVFDDEELRFVSDLTKSVIIPTSQGRLTVHSQNAAGARSARRTLLSLLDCQSPTSLDTLSGPITELRKQLNKTADATESGLHRRVRTRELTRTISPQESEQQPQPQGTSSKTKSMPPTRTSGPSEEFAQNLEHELERVTTPMNGTDLWPAETTSYWRNEARLSQWEAEFCRLLQADEIRRQRKLKQSESETLVQSVVLGPEALLSYFDPTDLPRPLNLQMGEKRTATIFDRRLPFLNAHFIPRTTSSTAAPDLPRITMRFRFSAPTSSGEPRELKLFGIRAKIDEQRLKVKLPDEAMDLCFTRNTSMISRIGLALQDKDISYFCEKLRESVQLGEGALDAPSELSFKLPRLLVHKGHAGNSDAAPEVNVPYMFERFEQVQSVEFSPSAIASDTQGIDIDAVEVIKSLPSGSYLDYREADGGAVCGASTSLSLRIRPVRMGQSTPENADAALNKSHGESQAEAVSANDQASNVSHEVVDTADHEAAQERLELGCAQAEATASEGSGEVQAVEKNAESSSYSAANTLSALVGAALNVARLLTRGNSGSLKPYRRERQ